MLPMHLARPVPRSQGAELLKHGRLGRPKVHYFRLAEGDAVLTWRSAHGKLRSIPLAAVTQVPATRTCGSLTHAKCSLHASSFPECIMH